MKLLTPSRAQWLAFLPLAAGCVQITDFADSTEGSDGSTTGAEESESTGAADESSTGSGETSDVPPDAGDSAWLQVSEKHSAYYGVARASDGRVRALGEQAVHVSEPRALARIYSANGETFEDEGAVPNWQEYWQFTDACERPDGGVFLLSFLDHPNPDTQSAVPLLWNLDPSGSFVNTATYTGTNGEVYPTQIANTHRMVCDADGRAWVALTHIYANHPSVLLARFDAEGFDGYEQVISDIDDDYAYELLGIGRDELGNIHLAVQTGLEPATGGPLVRWLRYDAEGVAQPAIGLDASELPSTPVLGFTARGSRVVITTVDTALDLTWVVGYDLDGTEQWRTSAIPSPADGWTPGPVGVGEDGRVVMMASVGIQPDQHLGLLELDGSGVLRWSAEYPFDADGQPELDHMELAGLDVGPSTIDVVGSATIDGGDQVGWVRRVLR